MIGINYLPL